MEPAQLLLKVPEWFASHRQTLEAAYATIEERMAVAIGLSRLNVERGTGGPFGAAMFERDSGRLLAVGVNSVEASGCSVAHAEITAIMAAQAAVGTYDLGGNGQPAYELVSSTEPCAMCFGAIHWSGVRRLVCGARDEDARSIGFDEGPKLSDWVGALEERGIQVVRDVLRADAVSVLRRYQANGGVIYNARQG
jgi:tRNA(Arg) A34 adenosine deaminase TadA